MADRYELLFDLKMALTHKRRAPQREKDDLTARLAAEQVLEHLERCGYVLLQKPPAGDSAPRGSG